MVEPENIPASTTIAALQKHLDTTPFQPIDPTLVKEAIRLIEFFRAPQQYILTDELRGILGTICFQAVNLARLLRESDSALVAHKAEDEQAVVIHWKLNLYLKHGADWPEYASRDITRMVEIVEKKRAAATPDASA